MADKIEANLLTKLMNFFDKLGSAIERIGLKVEKERTLEGGLRELTIQLKSDENKEILVQTIPVKYKNEDGWFKVKYWKVENGTKSDPQVRKNPIKFDSLEQDIQQQAYTYYKENMPDRDKGPVDIADQDIDLLTEKRSASKDAQFPEASQKLNVRLHKVVADDECSIYLTGITANYSEGAALLDLDTLLASDEFIAALPEFEATYSVSPTEGGLDVEPCDPEDCEICIYDDIMSLIGHITRLKDDVQCIYWNIHSKELTSIWGMLSSLRWQLESDADKLAEVVYECSGHVGRPVYDMNRIFTDDENVTVETGIPYIIQGLNDLINILTLRQYNFEECYRPMISETIRTWKGQISQLSKLI